VLGNEEKYLRPYQIYLSQREIPATNSRLEREKSLEKKKAAGDFPDDGAYGGRFLSLSNVPISLKNRDPPRLLKKRVKRGYRITKSTTMQISEEREDRPRSFSIGQVLDEVNAKPGSWSEKNLR